jgi:hypothetical protein
MSSLYEDRHIEQFNDNIDKLLENVNKKKVELMDPSLEEIDKVNTVIFDFIKLNKRKIYGGIALQYLLEESGESIYEEYERPDIDFYSHDPINDLVKLTTELHEKNFKSVRGKEAMHKETYAIYVNGRLYCNISYVPKNIFNSIPFKTINNVNIVHPHFLNIDYLRVFTDPIVSYWRLKDKKTFERYFLLQKYHPLPYNNKPINISENTEKTLLDIVLEFTKNKDTMIHNGFFAYNYYLKESQLLDKPSSKFKTINIPYYEIVSVNYKCDTLDLIKTLKESCDSDKLSIEEHFQFFQYLGYSTSIKYNDVLICTIYHSNNRCVPYKTCKIDSNNYLIGTFNYVLLNNLSTLIKYKTDRNEESKNLQYTVISHLIEMRKFYFKRTKKTIFDKSPFQDFSLDYKGSTLSSDKERQMIGELRKKKNKPFLFSYEPANKKESEQIVKYIFANTSGNIIKNPKKSQLKETEDIEELEEVSEETEVNNVVLEETEVNNVVLEENL